MPTLYDCRAEYGCINISQALHFADLPGGAPTSDGTVAKLYLSQLQAAGMPVATFRQRSFPIDDTCIVTVVMLLFES